MSYRIAICDDSPQDAGFVQNILDRWARERGVELRVEHFPSAESFLFRYEEDKAWDILLPDIELDERFCRVGRAMILNLKYVQRVTKTEVHLSNGTVLPLPGGAYEPLNRAIIERT